MLRQSLTPRLLCVVVFTLWALQYAGEGVWQGTVAHAQKPTDAPGFPSELVDFVPGKENPVFTHGEPGAWDAAIRERGWIMREGETYHMWYTGYESREGIRRLGYATSSDGLHWTRWPDNPLIRDHWVEDMMVVKDGDTYYLFAEGVGDEAQLLTSKDRVHWKLEGKLDVRNADGGRIAAGPYGTPTAWLENGIWYLFYERGDKGIWLATSRDLKVFKNVQDAPVISLGPARYDLDMIALNQVIKHRGEYFAYFHGSGDDKPPRKWTTNVARSQDLLHWEKYPKNPIVEGDKSSGIVLFDGQRYLLYTMHNQVDVYYPRGRERATSIVAGSLMAILNLGSLNIDRVFRVAHIARPSETIASRSLEVFAGGKGANQSVALARAGAVVAHAGRIGDDGKWLLEKLDQEGIDTCRVLVGAEATGQAMIQVDDQGQNSIVLLGGANHAITPDDVDRWLADFPAGSWLLVQNETSAVGHAIQCAKSRGMRVACNPAPIDQRVRDYPLHQVDLLSVNLEEGAALVGQGHPESIAAALAERYPDCEIVLTLGSDGVLARGPQGEFRLPARPVDAVDTTAAGDTFVGYYLAGIEQGASARESLELASHAAALCVTRRGALDSIPRLSEVVDFR